MMVPKRAASANDNNNNNPQGINARLKTMNIVMTNSPTNEHQNGYHKGHHKGKHNVSVHDNYRGNDEHGLFKRIKDYTPSTFHIQSWLRDGSNG